MALGTAGVSVGVRVRQTDAYCICPGKSQCLCPEWACRTDLEPERQSADYNVSIAKDVARLKGLDWHVHEVLTTRDEFQCGTAQFAILPVIDQKQQLVLKLAEDGFKSVGRLPLRSFRRCSLTKQKWRLLSILGPGALGGTILATPPPPSCGPLRRAP